MGLKKATIIDGKEFSSRTNQSLLPNVKLIVEKIGRPPALAVILVGEDAASHVYVRNKVKKTKEAGMVSIEHQLSAKTSEKTLLSLINSSVKLLKEIFSLFIERFCFLSKIMKFDCSLFDI